MTLLVDNTTRILENLSGEFKKDLNKFYTMIQKTSDELVKRKPKCSIYTNLDVSHIEFEKLATGKYITKEIVQQANVLENFEVINAGFGQRLVERSEQIFGVPCKDLSEVLNVYTTSVCNDIISKCKQPANTRILKKYHDGKLVSMHIQELKTSYLDVFAEIDREQRSKSKVSKTKYIPCCKLSEGKHIDFKITKHAKKAKKICTVFSYIKEIGSLQQANEELTKQFSKLSLNVNLKMDQLEQVWEKYKNLRMKYDDKKKQMIAGLKEKKQQIKNSMKEDIASYRNHLKDKIGYLKDKANNLKDSTRHAMKRITKLNRYIKARNNPTYMRAAGYVGTNPEGLPICSIQEGTSNEVDQEWENAGEEDYDDHEALYDDMPYC